MKKLIASDPKCEATTVKVPEDKMSSHTKQDHWSTEGDKRAQQYASPSKKSKKLLERSSPIKKSADMSKINCGSPGKEKYTKDIADVAGTQLPSIVSLPSIFIISFILDYCYFVYDNLLTDN